MAAGVLHSHNYGSIVTGGAARVQLGDVYAGNKDLFESGTEEERCNGMCE